MNAGRVVSALVLSIAVASIQPAPVHACSCLAEVLARMSDPADGAVDVPLNKAPVIGGMFVADSVVLEDDAGQSVAVALNAGPNAAACGSTTWAELIPKQPLKSNTRYTIRVEPDPSVASQRLPNTLTFTTGVDMLEDEKLTTPVGRASTLQHVRDGFDCGPSNAMTCVDVSPSKNIEVIARRGNRVLMRTLYPELYEGMFGFEETPDCIELRQRSATGKRSAPLTMCGDALPTREFRDSDLQGGLSVACKGGVIGNSGTDKADDGANTPKDPPTTVAADAGPKSDSDVNAPPKWPHEGAAGARAPASDSNSAPASDEAKHRTYGCSAAPDARSLSAQWSILFALVLAAYVIRRGARSRES